MTKHASAAFAELLPTLAVALPAVATNLLATMLQMVDASFVGHIGTRELAAAALGNAIFNLPWCFILGVSTALDTLASQAHGAGDAAAVRRWGQTAAIVLVALCVPGGLLLAAGEWAARELFGQSADVAELTGEYCSGLIWGVRTASNPAR